MSPPRHILVPTDLSPSSAHVAGYAVHLAEGLGAAVDLLHVFAFPYDWYYWDVPELASLRGAVEEHARDTLDALATRLARLGVPIRARFVVRGCVASAILESAETEGTDLIVMGAGSDLSTPSELGSVTEQVLRCCAHPVLVANDETMRRAFRPRVLVPVGEAEAGCAALRTALPLAASLGGQTHVVHVQHFTDEDHEDEAREEQSHYRAVEDVLRTTAEAGTPVGISVDGGDPVEAVVDTAASERADLIVLGISEWGGTRQAERLALAAPCPVLVVPVAAPTGGDGARLSRPLVTAFTRQLVVH